MLLTLQDDDVLRVYETPDMAAMEVEALDAEEVFRAIFDETGQPYAIKWIVPNEYTRSFFGLFKGAINGQYRLVPKGASDPSGLLRAIRAARGIATDEGDGWQLVIVDLPGVQRTRDSLVRALLRR